MKKKSTRLKPLKDRQNGSHRSKDKAQVTIVLDRVYLTKLRDSAEKKGLSLNRYVNDLLKKQLK